MINYRKNLELIRGSKWSCKSFSTNQRWKSMFTYSTDHGAVGWNNKTSYVWYTSIDGSGVTI